MAQEDKAIIRNPPGSSNTNTGCVDTRYKAQALTLVAATASARTKVLTTADSSTGCFVTFKNPGTTTITICFGDVTLPDASAVAGDYDILPGEKEEWFCTLETHFSALCASGNVLKRYRSSN
jgi:hypothetical protein